MSKYNKLWEYIKSQEIDSLKLSYDEIEQIAGVPIDHSFLTFKKELLAYVMVYCQDMLDALGLDEDEIINISK